jgi:tRNA-modifying protein YgfZ
MPIAFVPRVYGDYGARTLIRISGRDFASYLHNLCSQDIRGLKPGEYSEAFITNVQGKTIGYVRLFREADSILLDTSAGQAKALLDHFEKYHITEKIEFADISEGACAMAATFELIDVICAECGLTPPLDGKQFAKWDEGGGQIILTRWEVAGPGLGYCLISGESGVASTFALLRSVGAAEMSREEVEARRIAAGSPEFGLDVTAENLPQEAARDAQAISFNKGCYLGQETVARIDALGHVNRLLVKLRGEGKIEVRAGDVLTVDEKTVGNITSAAYWERENRTVALGYVRRGSHSAGTDVIANGAKLQVSH